MKKRGRARNLCGAIVLSLVAGPVLAKEIPGASGSAPIPIGCGLHTVQPGETLGGIAAASQIQGLTAADIFHENRDTITHPDKVSVGITVQIPCESHGHARNAPVTVTPKIRVTILEDAPSSVVTWKASAGDDLVAVLRRWGKDAGYEVIVERGSNWRFGVPFTHSGDFREAIDEVLAGFASSAVPPVVTIYTNNVMTIGVR